MALPFSLVIVVFILAAKLLRRLDPSLVLLLGRLAGEAAEAEAPAGPRSRSHRRSR